MKKSFFASFHGLASNIAHFWLLSAWPALRDAGENVTAESMAVFLNGRRFSLSVFAPLSPLLLVLFCFAVAWFFS